MYESMMTAPKMWLATDVSSSLGGAGMLTLAEENEFGPLATFGTVLVGSSLGLIPPALTNAGIKSFNKNANDPKFKGYLESIGNFFTSTKINLGFGDDYALQSLLAKKIQKELSKDPNADISVILQKFTDEDIPTLREMTDDELLKVIQRESDVKLPLNISDDSAMQMLYSYRMEQNPKFTARLKNILENQNIIPIRELDRLRAESTPEEFLKTIQTLYKNQSDEIAKKYTTYLDDYSGILQKEFGLNEIEANRELATVIRESYDVFRGVEKQAWTKLESTAFSKEVLPEDFFAPIVGAYKDIQLKGQISDTPLLPKAVETELKAIQTKLESGEKITFDKVYNLKRRIRKNMEVLQGSTSADAQEIIGNLIKLDQSLLLNAENVASPSFKEALLGAKQATFNKHEIFSRNPMVYRVMNKSPRGNYQLQDRDAQSILALQNPKFLEEDVNAITKFLTTGTKDAVKAGTDIGKDIVIRGEKAIQSILGNLINKSLKPDGKIDVTGFYTFIKQNENLIKKFPDLENIINKYKGNFSQLEKDIDANVFGLNVKGRDKITGEIIFDTPKDTAIFSSFIGVDNPVPIIQQIIKDTTNGQSKINTLAITTSKDSILKDGLKTTIIDAILTDVKNNGAKINGILNTKVGQKTLGQTLVDNKIFTQKEITGLKLTSEGIEDNVKALTNLKLTETNTDTFAPSEMLSAIFRAQGSKGFMSVMQPSMRGDSLIVAGRGAAIGQKVFNYLNKNKNFNAFLEDVILDPQKTKYIFNLVNNMEKGKISTQAAWNNWRRIATVNKKSLFAGTSEPPAWFKELMQGEETN